MVRRTTVSAEEDDLDVLAGEARRRGTSLARILSEAVHSEADRLRRGRTPRVGTFRAEVSIAAEMEADSTGPASSSFR